MKWVPIKPTVYRFFKFYWDRKTSRCPLGKILAMYIDSYNKFKYRCKAHIMLSQLQVSTNI